MSDLDRFAHLVSGDEVPLALAFLAFARAEYPELDEEACLEHLDALGERARRRIGVLSDPAAAVAELSAELVAQGFRGSDEDDYYDPDNSMLNIVLERRRGIPISLSVLWIECGRRAGVPLVGIGMPAHFLVGFVPGRGARRVLCDPFNGGKVLDEQEAIMLFGRVTGGGVPWRDEYLEATPGRDVVRRALNNLKSIYNARSDLTSALWVSDHLLAIPDAPPSELSDRAATLSGLGRFRDAISDLRAYVETKPDDADEAEAEIRSLTARMN